MRYLVVLLAVCAISCEVVVDVDIPIKPASITVHSTINPDSTFQVQLTASQNILSNNQFSTIPEATVNIYDGEILVETLVQNSEDGYKGTLKPLKGHTYTIEASKTNYKTVTATDVVPSQNVKLSKVTFAKKTNDEYNQQQYSMTIEFDDPKGENYYEIGLYGPELRYERDEDTGEYVVVDTVIIQYPIDSEDGIFTVEQYYSDRFWTFSDDVVDGKTVKINFNTYIYPFWNETVDEVEVLVAVREISYSMFKYKQTANLQRSLDGDPFAEPVPVYNNVKNGYGIFGAYQQTTSTVTVRKEE
ncbi:MAG: DUF4249 domain-containing protein [Imperialibacter sp.]|uniref:DUF4249 domain-containing protein n=1 Tax=Imperialibacter sp. TaxID=2038411 RepID=UPI0032EE4418